MICLDMCNCPEQAYFKSTVKSVYPTKWSSLSYMAGISYFQWTPTLRSYLNTNGQYFLVSKLIMIWHIKQVMKWQCIFYHFNNVTYHTQLMQVTKLHKTTALDELVPTNVPVMCQTFQNADCLSPSMMESDICSRDLF